MCLQNTHHLIYYTSFSYVCFLHFSTSIYTPWRKIFYFVGWYIFSSQKNAQHKEVQETVTGLVHCRGCKLVQPSWKTVWRFLKKLKIELPYDPATPLLGIPPKKMKTLIRKHVCTPMFVAALFTRVKIWKQPKCPLTDEWIKKRWSIYTQWNTTQS